VGSPSFGEPSAVGEVGVCISESELSELNDPDETETERALRGRVPIEIGAECLTESFVNSFAEFPDIF
jgi:hypothetical protein